MSDNIKVYARIKPTKKPSGYFETEAERGAIEFDVPVEADGGPNNTRTRYKFGFDGVLDMGVQQPSVFDTVAKDVVLSALDGFNGTVFAYGQTGSGKTFSITGGSEKYDDRGIIPRALELLFAEFKKRPDTQFTAHVSFLEIYNESGFDLLDPNHEANNELQRVTCLTDEDGNVHLRNLSMHMATSEEEALNMLFLGDTNRAMCATEMNPNSSRSHCIFTVSIQARQPGSDVSKRSKLHLVDLAGSERVHKSNAKDQVLREAKYINSSLHYLQMVIVALHERASKKGGREHIPYRNSMMTTVLKDSLGGNCKTVMLATLSAEKRHTGETLSTCRFAQRVAHVRNAARVNEEVDPALELQRLRAEARAMKEEMDFIKAQAGGQVDDADVTPEAELELREKVRTFLEDPDPGADLRVGRSFKRVKLAFRLLKAAVGEAGRGRAAEADGAAAREATEELKALRLRLAERDAQLQQRDREIAILTNIIRSGAHTGATGSSPSIRSAGASVLASTPASSYSAPASVADDAEAAEAAEAEAASRTSASIVRQHGVASASGAPVTAETLRSREHAFRVFREGHPQSEVMEANKRSLRDRIGAAKAVGEAVRAARERIQELKRAVESARLQRAVQELSGEGAEDAASAGHEEARLKEDMAAAKADYRDGFERLRQLEGEIKKIKALLERSRKQLHDEFNEWHERTLAALAGGEGSTLMGAAAAAVAGDGSFTTSVDPDDRSSAAASAARRAARRHTPVPPRAAAPLEPSSATQLPAQPRRAWATPPSTPVPTAASYPAAAGASAASPLPAWPPAANVAGATRAAAAAVPQPVPAYSSRAVDQVQAHSWSAPPAAPAVYGYMHALPTATQPAYIGHVGPNAAMAGHPVAPYYAPPPAAAYAVPTHAASAGSAQAGERDAEVADDVAAFYAARQQLLDRRQRRG